LPEGAKSPPADDRTRAESFGALADQYDRARPTYPPQLIDALLEDGPQRVLDVGCGTGIATALLAARGCRVLGVEVDERMAELARAKGLEIEVSSFEQWDARGRVFDLLTAAQSWHWIDPHAGPAKAASVLRPGGHLGLFWNLGEPPPEIHERLVAIYRRLEPGMETDSTSNGRGERMAATIAESGEFDALRSVTFHWTTHYDTTAWIDFLATHSDHHTLPPARRERLLAAVAAELDALGGAFEMPYETILVSAERR
jgi:SAM-dependent methyltransferase